MEIKINKLYDEISSKNCIKFVKSSKKKKLSLIIKDELILCYFDNNSIFQYSIDCVLNYEGEKEIIKVLDWDKFVIKITHVYNNDKDLISFKDFFDAVSIDDLQHSNSYRKLKKETNTQSINYSFTIDCKKFYNMINQTICCTSNISYENTQTLVCDIAFEFKKKSSNNNDYLFNLLGTDGKRFHLSSSNIQNIEYDGNFGVYKEHLEFLKSILRNKKHGSIMNISFNDNFITFSIDNMIISSRIIKDLKILNYQDCLPKRNPIIECSFDKFEVLKILKEIKSKKIITLKERYPLKMIIENNNVNFEVDNKTEKYAKSIHNCASDGVITIGINYLFLLDLFTCIQQNTVIVNIYDDIKPITVIYDDFKGLICLIRLLKK